MGSIPDEITGFFKQPKPSSRTMTLESTQPLTEMGTRNLHMGKAWPVRKADDLTAIYVLTLENVQTSTSHNPTCLHGLSQG
jgi:hypothetical protein